MRPHGEQPRDSGVHGAALTSPLLVPAEHPLRRLVARPVPQRQAHGLLPVRLSPSASSPCAAKEPGARGRVRSCGRCLGAQPRLGPALRAVSAADLPIDAQARGCSPLLRPQERRLQHRGRVAQGESLPRLRSAASAWTDAFLRTRQQGGKAPLDPSSVEAFKCVARPLSPSSSSLLVSPRSLSLSPATGRTLSRSSSSTRTSPSSCSPTPRRCARPPPLAPRPR